MSLIIWMMVMPKWELIPCRGCEGETEADYDGTYWTCKACGWQTDGPEGIVDVEEREYYRKEYEREKQERAFYREFETPNERADLV